jgi:hypothetical protein
VSGAQAAFRLLAVSPSRKLRTALRLSAGGQTPSSARTSHADAITRAFNPGVPIDALTLLAAIAAFYLPSAALFERGR